MHPNRWRRGRYVAFGSVVLTLIVVAVLVAALLADGDRTPDAALPPVPAAVTPDPGVVPVSATAPMPTTKGLAAALAGPLADPDLGALTGRIADALTGRQLWAQGADVPMQPASTNKALTAAAALLTLDREDRLTTRVVAADQTDQPGVIVLVGGGDTTISTAAPGTPTWYRGAARMSDLANQVRRSGIKVTAVQVDTSLYSGPKLAPGWDPEDIEGGDIAPMESVMIDGGRVQPTTVESKRSMTPALDAGRALAAALGADPDTVTTAPGPATGRELASVQSAPLMQRLTEMMNASDNVMAEAIGREVAAELHKPLSFNGGVAAVTAALTGIGINLKGAVLRDGSGLSVDDRLTATTLDEVMSAATGSQHPQLRPMLDLLPIAGGSGTLGDRFLGDANRATAGWLRAKTGSLTGTNALAGVVTDRSGRVLTFSFLSNGAGPTGRTAIDNLAAVLRTCGCT
jgi:D-alanyl-D-alanine carboxypeptidase/D-alanyl-D-alanine-endopeptidase (penicillin-binding protein 4)